MLTLHGGLAVLQAPLFDGLLFDPLSCLQDGPTASEADIGRCQIAQALVTAVVIVVVNENGELFLQIWVASWEPSAPRAARSAPRACD